MEPIYDLIPEDVVTVFSLCTRNFNTTNCNSYGCYGMGTDTFSVGREALKAVLFHPCQYITALIEIGYEPLPPSGYPLQYYPNKIQYMCHIYVTSGLSGLYRGLLGNVAYRTTRYWVVNYMLNKFYYCYPCQSEANLVTDVNTEEQSWLVSRCIKTMWEVVSVSTAIVASHPFYVIMIRRMGSIAGGETSYDGWFSCVTVVYETEGIFGYFKGLMLRLVAGAIRVIVPAVTAYTVTKIANEVFSFYQWRLTDAIGRCMGLYYANPKIHNYKVASKTMAVNNSGLAIGTIPYAPVFRSDTECYTYLMNTNQLHRGISWFLRPYTGSPMLLVQSSATNSQGNPISPMKQK